MEKCRSLAQKGEEEIKKGNTDEGIKLLEEAVAAGTQDTSLLSAIYCQLGNGYYANRDFDKATFYHSNDLIISQVLNDPVLEVKALCNLSHALTMNKCFERAIDDAMTVIKAAPTLSNAAIYECRGYYALGFAYFHQFLSTSTSSNFDDDSKELLNKAANFYEHSLAKSQDENEAIVQGCSVVRSLTVGNLGIIYYYLGQFEKARHFCEMRLNTAKSVGDKQAQIRTYTNLGNTCVQLGDYEAAVVYYNRALAIANRSRRLDLAAQLHFSIASTESLQNNHKEALSNHLAHLELARTLNDTAGQTRAYLNLANCLERLQELPKALYFLSLYWKLTESLNDSDATEKARDAVEQMIHRHPHEIQEKEGNIVVEDCSDLKFGMDNAGTSKNGRKFRLSNLSESLESFIVDYSKKRRSLTTSRSRLYEVDESRPSLADSETDCGLQRPSAKSRVGSNSFESKEDFFDFLAVAQGSRLDDQRCDAVLVDRTNESRQGDSLNRFEFKEPKEKMSIMKKIKKRVPSSMKLMKTQVRQSLPFRKSDSLSTRNIDQTSLYSSKSINRLNSVSSRNSGIDFDYQSQLSLNFDNDSANVPINNCSIITEDSGDMPSESVEDGTSTPTSPAIPHLHKDPTDILDLIMNMQGRRMDEQRADPILPGLNNRDDYLKTLSEQNDGGMSERLYDIIMERQCNRLDDQRSELGGRPRSCSDLHELPKELADLVTKSAKRYEDQRAYLKPHRASASDIRTSDTPPARCASASPFVNLEAS